MVRKIGRPKDPELERRRREQILDAASTLFAEQGYTGTDVQVLADRLGLGKGTIYRYYPSKRQLFRATVEWGLDQLHGRLADEQGLPSDPLLLMRELVCRYMAYFDEHPRLIALCIQERAVLGEQTLPSYFEHRDRHLDRWRQLLQRLMAAGVLREMPVDRLLDVTGDLLYGTIFTNFLAGRTQPLGVQAREILDVLMLGCLTDEQRTRYREKIAGRWEDPA